MVAWMAEHEPPRIRPARQFAVFFVSSRTIVIVVTGSINFGGIVAAKQAGQSRPPRDLLTTLCGDQA